MFVRRWSSLVVAASLVWFSGSALGVGADDRPLPPATTLSTGLDDSIARVQGMFPNAKVVDVLVGRHGGRWVYQVKTFRGTTLRTVKIDVGSGQVVVNKRETAAGQRLGNLRRAVQLLNVVATTRAEAIQAAEAAVPGAKAYEVELDDFNDQMVFKVKLLDGARRVVVLVGADDGKVVPVPGDGVMNLSIDDAAARAASLFPGWTLVKVELDDDRGFDDSGQYYQLQLTNAAGTSRRDVKLHANTGAVLRDRTRTVGGGTASEYQAIVAAADPAVSFGKAAMIAADSIAGSRVHETRLKIEEGVLVYEVELIKADGTGAEVKIDASTGQFFDDGGNPGGGNPGGSAITSSQAAAIALARVPGTTVREISLDSEEGIAVYEVKLINASGQRTDVKVAVATGEVVRVEAKN